jgi:hypothetical protein
LGLFPDDHSPAVPDGHTGTRCRSLAPLRLQPGQAVRRDKGGFGHAGLSGYIKDKALEVGRSSKSVWILRRVVGPMIGSAPYQRGGLGWRGFFGLT